MNVPPHLIQVPIVPSLHDAFWQPQQASQPAAGPCRVLVITTPYVPAGPEEVLLNRMLKDACKLNEADYAVLQMQEGQRWALHMVCSRFEPTIILLLGVLPAALGIAALLQYGAPNHFAGRVLLPGPSLQDMIARQELRRALFESGLKPAFGL